MITPVIGNVYIVHHTSGNIQARCTGIRVTPGFHSPHSSYVRRATTHYDFVNLNTGRDIMIRSRQKIRAEVQ